MIKIIQLLIVLLIVTVAYFTRRKLLLKHDAINLKTSSLVLAFVVSVVVAFSFADYFTPKRMVSVTALNQKNENSKSTQIYISHFSLNKFFCKFPVPVDGNWIKQDNKLCWFDANDKRHSDSMKETATFKTDIFSDVSVCFAGNKYKGKAVVKVEDKVINVDTYVNSENWKKVQAKLPSADLTTMAKAGIQFVLFFTVSLLFMLILSCCFVLSLSKANSVVQANYKNNESIRKRNYALEFYRFCFSLVIVFLHFREYDKRFTIHGGGGYLAVEFFFIVGGFMLMQSVELHRDILTKERPSFIALKYLKKRYLRLFPQYLLSFLLLGSLHIFVFDNIPAKLFVTDYFWEAFMLQILGIGKYLNVVMWFVSAMLLASFALFYLLIKFRDDFSNIILPICVLIIYAYFFQTNGGMHGIGLSNHKLIVCDGFWRAFAGLGVGCIAYKFYVWIFSRIKGRFSIIATLFELFVLALIAKRFYGHGCNAKDFILIVLMALFVASVMSENSYLTRVLNCKFSKKLGGISYAIYCNHPIANVYMRHFFYGKAFMPLMLWQFVFVIAFSFLTTWLCNTISAAFSGEKRNSQNNIGIDHLKE